MNDYQNGDWDDDDIDAAIDLCGLNSEGWCMDSGTEHCQFWCPFHMLIDDEARAPAEITPDN